MVDLAELKRPRNVEEQTLDLDAYLAERGITLEEHKEKMLIIATEQASRIQLSPMTRLALRDAGLSFREKVQQVDSGFNRALLASLPPAYILAEAKVQARSVDYYLRQYGYGLDVVQNYYFYELPDPKRVKFQKCLNKLTRNIYPTMSVQSICILWLPHYEDEKWRRKLAKKLIRLILGYATEIKTFSQNMPFLSFEEQEKALLNIDDFQIIALKEQLGSEACDFLAYWRENLSTDISCSSNNEDVKAIEQRIPVKNEPIPVKGNKESMKNWIRHVITIEKKLSLDEPLYAGLQQELIKRVIDDYGYKDGSVVKSAWAALNLKSAHKTT